MTKELLLRVHTLQLQQLAAIHALSGKIDLALERLGATPEQMADLRTAESHLLKTAYDAQLKEWEPLLKTLIE